MLQSDLKFSPHDKKLSVMACALKRQAVNATCKGTNDHHHGEKVHYVSCRFDHKESDSFLSNDDKNRKTIVNEEPLERIWCTILVGTIGLERLVEQILIPNIVARIEERMVDFTSLFFCLPCSLYIWHGFDERKKKKEKKTITNNSKTFVRNNKKNYAIALLQKYNT